MSDRVAEIERGAAVLFEWIFFNDSNLHSDRPADEFGCVPFAEIEAEARHAEQDGIANHSVLDDFSHAGRELTSGKRRQQTGIYQYQSWIMERTDKVLPLWQVKACLTTQGWIDHCQQRRRHAHPADATHESGCDEACQVARHAAAQCNDHAVAIQLGVQEIPPQSRDGMKILGRFTRRKGAHAGLVACLPEGLHRASSIQARDGLVCNDGNRSAKPALAHDLAQGIKAAG
jgi:hypothetical protein